MEDVADDRTRRRGDDADHLGQEGQRPLARGIEEALGRELLAALLEQLQQGALAGELHASMTSWY